MCVKLVKTCVLYVPQVVTGGHYDVDVEVFDPYGKEIFKKIKTQYDSFTWTADVGGEFRACFSNEFSTFSHKLVYVDFQVGEERPLPGVEGHLTAMTLVSTQAFLTCFRDLLKITLLFRGEMLSASHFGKEVRTAKVEKITF